MVVWQLAGVSVVLAALMLVVLQLDFGVLDNSSSPDLYVREDRTQILLQTALAVLRNTTTDEAGMDALLLSTVSDAKLRKELQAEFHRSLDARPKTNRTERKPSGSSPSSSRRPPISTIPPPTPAVASVSTSVGDSVRTPSPVVVPTPQPTPSPTPAPPDALIIPDRGAVNWYHFLMYMVANLTPDRVTFVPKVIVIPNRHYTTRMFQYRILHHMWPKAEILFDDIHNLEACEVNSTVHDVPGRVPLECKNYTKLYTFEVFRYGPDDEPAGRADPVSKDKYMFLRSLFLDIAQQTPVPANISKRLLISREVNQMVPDSRHIANEADVMTMLQPFGFQLLSVHGIDPFVQMSIFAHAEVIIAVHGAALASTVFCSDQTVVIEVATPEFGGMRHFSHIAQVFHLRYHRLIQQIAPSTLHNVLINVAQLQSLLTNTLKLQPIISPASASDTRPPPPGKWAELIQQASQAPSRLVYVFLGHMPSYIVHSMAQARLWNPKALIVLVGSPHAVLNRQQKGLQTEHGVVLLTDAELRSHPWLTDEFKKLRQVNPDVPKDIDRVVLAGAVGAALSMTGYWVPECDNLVYVDFEPLTAVAMKAYPGMATTPLGQNVVASGMSFVNRPHMAIAVGTHMADVYQKARNMPTSQKIAFAKLDPDTAIGHRGELNMDMPWIWVAQRDLGSSQLAWLPTLPDIGADTEIFAGKEYLWNHTKEYHGVFDCCSYGQYVAGINRDSPIPKDLGWAATHHFCGRALFEGLISLEYRTNSDTGRVQAFVVPRGRPQDALPIYNLHIYSKQLHLYTQQHLAGKHARMPSLHKVVTPRFRGRL